MASRIFCLLDLITIVAPELIVQSSTLRSDHSIAVGRSTIGEGVIRGSLIKFESLPLRIGCANNDWDEDTGSRWAAGLLCPVPLFEWLELKVYLLRDGLATND